VEELEELDEQTADPEFWANADRANDVVRQQNTIRKLVDELRDLQRLLDDGSGLYELGRDESDSDSIIESWELLDGCELRVAAMEFRRMLSGPHDANSAMLSVNAGAGGVDSQDWAEMMVRMYQRWGERQGFKVSVLDYQEADQAGIRSAEMSFEGDYAYGHLRSEIGVHRLVRISPFDAQARRQTSFASVMVIPEMPEECGKDAIEVPEADLRVDTYRASGAGGQHVNKTDSAIRLTHLPTGVVVACQLERSQHKNRATAMRMLRARLAEIERQKRSDEMAVLEGDKKKIEWGSQIRSYVLNPYRQVNDHRTELKFSNVDAVLDGELRPFMEAFLLKQGNRHHDE